MSENMCKLRHKVRNCKNIPPWSPNFTNYSFVSNFPDNLGHFSTNLRSKAGQLIQQWWLPCDFLMAQWQCSLLDGNNLQFKRIGYGFCKGISVICHPGDSENNNYEIVNSNMLRKSCDRLLVGPVKTTCPTALAIHHDQLLWTALYLTLGARVVALLCRWYYL